MPLANKIIPYYTYDDWLLWEGRWELYEGHPVAMSPTAIPRHQYVASALSSEFHQQLKKCKICKVYDPLDYKVSDDIILIPDILIVCRPIVKKVLDFAPSLVVEVLSPSTAIRDKNTKFEIYEREGIKYYLIVDAEKNSVEIYEWKDGKYDLCKTIEDTFEFLFEEDCKAIIDFKEIW